MTQRKLNGLVAFTSIFALSLFWIAIRAINESLLRTTSVILPMRQIDLTMLFTILIILTILIVAWGIRNRLFVEGFRVAFKRWRIIKNLRHQMINARFTDDDRLTENHGRILRLPKIKIVYENNYMTFKIYIQSTIGFDKRLEKTDISSALGAYIVERQYKSSDLNYHIYECFDSSTFTQKVFNKPKDYLAWANESTDDYSIRIDERTTIPLFHYGISGLTGSGKSMFLSSYIYQLKHKQIKHKFWIVDPKRDDIYNLSLLAFGESYTGDGDNAVQIIENFHHEMKKRQNEMNKLKKKKGNASADDFHLPALILIIDEFGALRGKWEAELKPAERKRVESMILDIVFMGRSLACYCHILTQQANAKVLPTQIRDNLPFKCVLWSSSDETYNVMFSQGANIPKMEFKQGQGVFSFPGIALEHEPRLLSTPYCKFLEDTEPEVLWGKEF